MSSNLASFWGFRVEGVSASVDTAPLETGVATEVNGSAPAIIVERVSNDKYIHQMNSPMSSNLVTFPAFWDFHAEGVRGSFNASSSEAGVVLEVNVSVSATAVEQVSKQNKQLIHRPNELTNVFEARGLPNPH
jgi:hypothetical protein